MLALLLGQVTLLTISNFRLKQRAKDSYEMVEKTLVMLERANASCSDAQASARAAIEFAEAWAERSSNHQASAEYWAGKYRDERLRNQR